MTQYEFIEVLKHIYNVIKDTEYEGHVYAVGGCVRDGVMNVPIKDIDLCVDIPNGGIEFANWLKENGHTKGSVVVYETYGTAMFHFAEFPEYEIEVVQTRGEQYHDKESRNPQVTFAPIDEDAVRRDLTMNALYINISADKLLDPTGTGMQDIQAKICRVTNENPDVVFQDDPLRILRVIRFAARYGFSIDDATYKSMIANVDRLSIITQERITDEFNKMISCGNPDYAMNALRETGAMKYVIPELVDAYDMEQNAFHFGTVWEHTVALLNYCKNITDYLPVRLACVFHDIGKVATMTKDENGKVHFYNHETVGAKMTKDIMMRMRYPSDVADEVSFYVRWHMLTKQWGADLSHMKMKTLRKLEYICGTYERFSNLMQVIDADNMSHSPEHCICGQTNAIMYIVDGCVANGTAMFGYKLPIDGNDVMEAMGIEPGKAVKAYLSHCLNLAFMNPEITKEECIKHCKSDMIKM